MNSSGRVVIESSVLKVFIQFRNFSRQQDNVQGAVLQIEGGDPGEHKLPLTFTLQADNGHNESDSFFSAYL